MNYVHLHGHSTFSFLEAIGKPNKIIAKTKELGMNAIGISDYNGMYCMIKFYQLAKDEKIKPIVGVELGFVLDAKSLSPNQIVGNIVLIARNKVGYQNLMELTSWANKEGIASKPKIDINILNKFKDGIVAIMGGGESWIGKMIVNDESESKIIEILQMIKNALGDDNVYLDIIAQDYEQIPSLNKINDKILEIAEKSKIKLLIHNDYHYVNKDDKDAWEVALAIKDGKKMYDEDRRKPKGDYHIMSEDEIREIFAKNEFDKKMIDVMIKNNEELAESINTEIDLGQQLFPNYDTAEDIKEIYEKVKDELVEE